MTELEKIAYTKAFIDKLAEGINPLDGTPIPQGDIVNHMRISRCFYYVSDILRQIIDNGGIGQAKTAKAAKAAKAEFYLSAEARSCFAYSEKPLQAKEIAERLNDMADPETMAKLPVTAITGWLVSAGLLENVVGTDGKSRKRPTDHGRAVGIFTEERMGQYGSYTAVLYSAETQRLLLDNLDAIIAYRTADKEQRQEAREVRRAERRAEKQSGDLLGFHNRPWSPEHDERLTYLFHINQTVSEMAHDLRRTEDGVRERLAVLGLIQL